MSSIIKTVSGPAAHAELLDFANGPLVVQSGRRRSAAADAYVSRLTFGPNYGQNSVLRDQLQSLPGADFGPKLAQIGFKVAGFCQNPDHAGAAKERFVAYAQKFFPDRPGRGELLHGLAEDFAELAAGMNRRTLFFLLRVRTGKPEQARVHADGSDFSSIAYLSDDETAAHVVPGSFDPAKVVQQVHDTMIYYEMPEGTAFERSPRYSLTSWLGLSLQFDRASKHVSDCNNSDLRVFALASGKVHARQPAHAAKPGLRQRLLDALDSGWGVR